MNRFVELVQTFGGIYAVIMVAFFLIREWRKKDHGSVPDNAKTPMPRAKRSWSRRHPVLLITLAILVIGIVYTQRHRLTGSVDRKVVKAVSTAPVDPCSQCRPDENTIGVDDADPATSMITWKWYGPCVGAPSCGSCWVKPGSCKTENDTDFAAKCACSKK